MEEAAAVQHGLRRVCRRHPEQVLGRQQTRQRGVDVADIAADGEIRKKIGDRDADLRARRVQLLLRRADVRPLLDQLRRQADGQIARQVQVGKSERLQRPFVRKGSGQRGQQIALLGERLAQRRQGRPRLRQRGLLRRHVGAIGIARVELAAENVEHLGVGRDQLVGGLDLPAQRGFGDGGDHDIGAQREIGRLDLKTLIVGLCFKRLNGAAVETPNIERVGHPDLRSVQGEGVRA